MKNTLFALAVCAVLASCSQGSGDAVIRKKVIDSMTNEFMKGHMGSWKYVEKPTGTRNEISKGKVTQKLPQDTSIFPYLIPMDTAKAKVLQWTDTLLANKSIIQDTNYRSFIIPMANFVFLNNSYLCDYVVFYISGDGNGISLIYEGGQKMQGIDSIALVPVIYQGKSNVFNHTIPCPECPMKGILDSSGWYMHINR